MSFYCCILSLKFDDAAIHKHIYEELLYRYALYSYAGFMFYILCICISYMMILVVSSRCRYRRHLRTTPRHCRTHTACHYIHSCGW